MELIPADRFTPEELADAYNRTRVDYIVPMPMSAARLCEYIQFYDVDLGKSVLVLDGDRVVGLGMVGLRPGRAWITRIGVLPSCRRLGIGRMLMEALLEEADALRLDETWLEVIKGNLPAHRLFKAYGFREVRELVVGRRAPGAAPDSTKYLNGAVRAMEPIDRGEVLELLRHRPARSNWLNESESFARLPTLDGLRVELRQGGRGWICFQVGALQISHIYVEVTAGDPVLVTTALLTGLHRRHPKQDAVLENIAVDDPVWTGYQQAGYFEAFERIEMVRERP
jgi:ribosomal protein S18 acetylase RimI-like enzyme